MHYESIPETNKPIHESIIYDESDSNETNDKPKKSNDKPRTSNDKSRTSGNKQKTSCNCLMKCDTKKCSCYLANRKCGENCHPNNNLCTN